MWIFLIAILFGIIEGITEWLPVSSTGHMIIFESIFSVEKLFANQKLENYGSDFWMFFLVVIQLGAILAVIIYFWNKLWPFTKKKNIEEKKETLSILWKTLIACVPAGIIGILLDDFFDQYFYSELIVSITLIVYGVIFIVLEILNKNKEAKIKSIKEMSYKTALLIGLFQLLAFIPGTSRSGVTILGAIMLGCSRETSAEFSFYLSIPIMFGASLIKGVKFLLEYHYLGTNEILFTLCGVVTAFVVSLITVKWLMNFVKKHDFKPFGIYRILLGLVVLGFFIFTNI